MKTLPNHKLFAAFSILAFLANAATAADVGVRIRFGLNDTEATNWDGTVSVKPGKVALVSGWRFEQDDHANGTDGWTASTRAVIVQNRTNNPKAKAKADANKAKTAENQKKPKANAKQKAGKAAANESGLADNGVLLTLTDVTENSLVTIKTKQGEIAFTLTEIPYGKYITKLEGGVEVERIGASLPLTSDVKNDDDYPSAAVAADGTATLKYRVRVTY